MPTTFEFGLIHRTWQLSNAIQWRRTIMCGRRQLLVCETTSFVAEVYLLQFADRATFCVIWYSSQIGMYFGVVSANNHNTSRYETLIFLDIHSLLNVYVWWKSWKRLVSKIDLALHQRAFSKWRKNSSWKLSYFSYNSFQISHRKKRRYGGTLLATFPFRPYYEKKATTIMRISLSC